MAEAFTSFTFTNLHIPPSSNYAPKQISGPNHGYLLSMKVNEKRAKNLMRGSLCVRKALPHDLPLMAVMVQQIEGMRDIITEKHVWHLSDKAIKNVYMFYIMFTCWGCLYFGSAKDPFYDSEEYRGDGGDGTGYWVYETQEDIEEKARAELWREELIEEIEQKVGSLRELEEAVTK
ncbi:Photosynthetic NDH subunit of subcomplex B 4 [Cardamine amara subsp. amara]|uniref:Photosynthetic NDH subunit of subcomplex B 4 n=1 Tax=Cardamine amara subsp. amara TaxID=228776 RepID=A0ABD1AMQ4_CARAN